MSRYRSTSDVGAPLIPEVPLPNKIMSSEVKTMSQIFLLGQHDARVYYDSLLENASKRGLKNIRDPSDPENVALTNDTIEKIHKRAYKEMWEQRKGPEDPLYLDHVHSLIGRELDSRRVFPHGYFQNFVSLNNDIAFICNERIVNEMYNTYVIRGMFENIEKRSMAEFDEMVDVCYNELTRTRRVYAKRLKGPLKGYFLEKWKTRALEARTLFALHKNLLQNVQGDGSKMTIVVPSSATHQLSSKHRRQSDAFLFSKGGFDRKNRGGIMDLGDQRSLLSELKRNGSCKDEDEMERKEEVHREELEKEEEKKFNENPHEYTKVQIELLSDMVQRCELVLNQKMSKMDSSGDNSMEAKKKTLDWYVEKYDGFMGEIREEERHCERLLRKVEARGTHLEARYEQLVQERNQSRKGDQKEHVSEKDLEVGRAKAARDEFVARNSKEGEGLERVKEGVREFCARCDKQKESLKEDVTYASYCEELIPLTKSFKRKANAFVKEIQYKRNVEMKNFVIEEPRESLRRMDENKYKEAVEKYMEAKTTVQSMARYCNHNGVDGDGKLQLLMYLKNKVMNEAKHCQENEKCVELQKVTMLELEKKLKLVVQEMNEFEAQVSSLESHIETIDKNVKIDSSVLNSKGDELVLKRRHQIKRQSCVTQVDNLATADPSKSNDEDDERETKTGSVLLFVRSENTNHKVEKCFEKRHLVVNFNLKKFQIFGSHQVSAETENEKTSPVNDYDAQSFKYVGKECISELLKNNKKIKNFDAFVFTLRDYTIAVRRMDELRAWRTFIQTGNDIRTQTKEWMLKTQAQQ